MLSSTRKQLIYWATQLVAWTVYAAMLGLWAWLNNQYSREQGQLLIVLMAIGIVCSHLFRAIIVKRKWLDLAIGHVIPRLVGTALLVGAVATFIHVLAHDLLFPQAVAMLGGKGVDLIGNLIDWTIPLFAWSIAYFAYYYFVHGRREEIRNLRLETASREDQLANLRAQLNPHFMFNALNGIRALIDEDPVRAKLAITQLSAILRNAMSTVKRKTVPLGEELDIVKAYLALEQMRYEERLRTSFDIDPALEREAVPPMLLQTLVENAVRHGIAKLTQGGEVHISVHRGPNGMMMSVRNSGEYAEGMIEGTGIGLQNTRRRLQMIYGETATLHIANREGMVVTEVEIPATQKETASA